MDKKRNLNKNIILQNKQCLDNIFQCGLFFNKIWSEFKISEKNTHTTINKTNITK